MKLDTILETTLDCTTRLYEQFRYQDCSTSILVVKEIILELQNIKLDNPYSQYIQIIDKGMPDIKKCITLIRQHREDYIYWKINIFIRQLIYLLDYCNSQSGITKFREFQDTIFSTYSLVNKISV